METVYRKAKNKKNTEKLKLLNMLNVMLNVLKIKQKDVPKSLSNILEMEMTQVLLMVAHLYHPHNFSLIILNIAKEEKELLQMNISQAKVEIENPKEKYLKDNMEYHRSAWVHKRKHFRPIGERLIEIYAVSAIFQPWNGCMEEGRT